MNLSAKVFIEVDLCFKSSCTTPYGPYGSINGGSFDVRARVWGLEAHHIVKKRVVGSEVLVTGLKVAVRMGGAPLTQLFKFTYVALQADSQKVYPHQVIQSCHRCYLWSPC